MPVRFLRGKQCLVRATSLMVGADDSENCRQELSSLMDRPLHCLFWSGSAESAECVEWLCLPCEDLPPRNSHAAVVDGETMILIGGASPDGQTDGVFSINLSERSNLSCRKVSCKPDQLRAPGRRESGDITAGVPAAREMHSACVYKPKGTEDAGATKILLMGGRSGTSVLRDLFSLDTGAVRGSTHERCCRFDVVLWLSSVAIKASLGQTLGPKCTQPTSVVARQVRIQVEEAVRLIVSLQPQSQGHGHGRDYRMLLLPAALIQPALWILQGSWPYTGVGMGEEVRR